MSHLKYAKLLSLLVAAAVSGARDGRAQTTTPSPVTQRQGIDTGCNESYLLNGYHLVAGVKSFAVEDYSVRAFRPNTPVYLDSSGDARAAKVLQFGERVLIADPGEGTGRMKIADLDLQRLGWVERNAVLCRLPAENQRIIVRTDTSERDQSQPRKLYQTPDPFPADQRCEGGLSRCLVVGRSQWYYSFGEENDHYLIASSADLRSYSARLTMGWLPKSDGYAWNTGLGLRPREELANVKAGSPEEFVCAYPTMEDLKKDVNCSEILGGMRWFGLSVRMPVLQEADGAYEVLLPTVGRASRDNRSSEIERLNRIDVFFIIDGSRGMQPAVDAIKSLSGRIVEHLKAKIGQGGVIRLGFRIYRASGKQADGVISSEFLALPNDNCNLSNIGDFVDAFAKVKAFDSPGVDFYTNSFGGMIQGGEDASGCPDNTKLFFVIGDTGYDAEKQKRGGFSAWSEAQVAQRMKRTGTGTPLIFFIQVPSNPTSVHNKENYTQSRFAFEMQARNINSAVYSGTALTGAFLIASGVAGDQIANFVFDQIDTFLNPGIVKMLNDSLRARESLVSIIERLRGDSRSNIPINYLTAILEGINRAYVPVDDNVIVEVLLSRNQLEERLHALRASNNPSGSGLDMPSRDRLRDGLRLLRTTDWIGNPRSKFLAYSDEELGDASKVPLCEIVYLQQYLARKYEILSIVQDGDGKIRPVFTEARRPEAICPNMSDKGRNLPFIEDLVRPLRLNPPDQQASYSIMHRGEDSLFFWLPINYFP